MKKSIIWIALFAVAQLMQAQTPVMETGGKHMPNEWIDKDTGHKVIKLTRRDGINMSFYFHNNPFIGNKMVFCGGSRKGETPNIKGQEIYNTDAKDLQMYWVDLNTLKTEQLTHESSPVKTEIVCARTREIFYQIKDSVFSLNTETRKKKLIFVFPENERSAITTVNADGSLLAGVFSNPKEAEIVKAHPLKSEFFNMIYEAKLPRTLFVIDTKTGVLKRIYSENEWLNHMQFSPVNPHLLMFCHEGPWHKVDRIWTIDVIKGGKPQLIHKRTMDMEIAGHEWFGSKGDAIYFDLQKPRGKKFFVGKTDLKTNKEISYELQRNEWSVHYTTSWGETLMAGDGGSSTSVAKAPNGQWIYLFQPKGNKLVSTKLVNMKNHNYHLEPNVHFSPDNKWIIFRANFEGQENVYAVQIEKK
ncbi:oligogalacturonate lyase family protein [uncultured Bacteroides sp.]|uniref:oligogalacturonate lyase family protein n=1 Tax=uncultured Bacteroides sp. TaxID=162156 RepID=UPI002AA6E7F3|nr:oligogalacturonate lyase family protein [uncultured Bacteroides sp.]